MIDSEIWELMISRLLGKHSLLELPDQFANLSRALFESFTSRKWASVVVVVRVSPCLIELSTSAGRTSGIQAAAPVVPHLIDLFVFKH